MATKENTVETIVPGSPLALALSLAKVIENDAPIMAEIATDIKAREISIRSFFTLGNLLALKYEGRMAEFPVPGSESAVGNRPADKYKDDAGNDRSIINDMCSALPIGIECDSALAGIKKASEQATDTPSEWQYLSARPDLVIQQRKAWTQKRSNLRTLVKKSVLFCIQMDKIEGMEHLDVDVMETFIGTDGKEGERLSTSTYPVIVSNAHKAKEHVALSPSQFLSLKLDSVKAQGGTFAALLASMKRAAKTPDATQTPVNKDTYENVLSLFVGFTEDDANSVTITRAVNNQKDKKRALDLLENIFAIQSWSAGYTSNPQYVNLYNALKAELNPQTQKPVAHAAPAKVG